VELPAAPFVNCKAACERMLSRGRPRSDCLPVLDRGLACGLWSTFWRALAETSSNYACKAASSSRGEAAFAVSAAQEESAFVVSVAQEESACLLLSGMYDCQLCQIVCTYCYMDEKKELVDDAKVSSGCIDSV